MRLLKFSLVILSVMVTTSANAAELLRCQAGQANVTVKRAANSSEGSGLFQANIDDPSQSVHTSTTVRRVRSAADLRYEDVLGGQSFKLVILNPVGTQIAAEAILDEGRITESRIPNLHCENSGSTLPAAPVCPSGDLEERIITAAYSESPAHVSFLLACGANSNAIDQNGCSPLQIVTDLSCGYQDVQAAIDPADTTAPQAPRHGARGATVLSDLMSSLISAGARLNSINPATRRTPLMNLVRSGHKMEIGILLSKGANLNVQDKLGQTALMYATERGDEIQIRMLLKKSPNLSIKDGLGRTAYDHAVIAGYREMADQLLRAQPKIQTVTGQTDGTCTPDMVHIFAGEEVTIRLTAPANAMFLLTAADLKIDLMAMPGESVEQTIKPLDKGTFPFDCRVHGGSAQTHGSFMVM